MCVYLLHFSARVSPNHTTQHYIGAARDVERRLLQHRAGRGSHLTRTAVERGIGITLARVWIDATFDDERRLKGLKNSPKLCPFCNPRIAHLQYQLPLDLNWSTLDQVDDDAERAWQDAIAHCAPYLHRRDGYEAWYMRRLREAARRPAPAVFPDDGVI